METDVRSPHEAYRFNDKRSGLFLVGYKSGNVVYQQGDTADEALKELLLEDGGYDYVIGTDEAGKGEWYGPLVVACIALKQKDIPAMRKKA